MRWASISTCWDSRGVIVSHSLACSMLHGCLLLLMMRVKRFAYSHTACRDRR